MASSTKHKTHLHKESSSSENRPARKKDRRLSAGTANRFDLYQRSVNSPETDVDFLIEAYETIRGRKPLHLREDFCGTANLAAEFLCGKCVRDEQRPRRTLATKETMERVRGTTRACVVPATGTSGRPQTGSQRTTTMSVGQRKI